MPTVLNQQHFRARWDTYYPDETAVWFDAADTNFNIAINSQFRIRIGLQEAGGVGTAGTTVKLQISRNAGAFQDVTSASTFVQSNTAASAAPNGTTITVQQLGGTGTFAQGFYSNNGSTSSAFAVAANGNTEVEFGLWFLNTLTAGDTIDFNVVTTAGTPVTIVTTPRATLVSPPLDRLFRQGIEAITTNPATVNLYRQGNEVIATNPAAIDLYRQGNEVIASYPSALVVYRQAVEIIGTPIPTIILPGDWNSIVQRQSNGSGRTQAHTARHPIGLAKYLHPDTTKFNAGMLIPNEIILEDKWHYGWDQPYYKRAPDRPQVMKNRSLRNPAQTYGRELEAPFYTSGNAGFTVVMSNWWQQLSMPRQPRLRGQTIYSKTWPGITQPLAQPPRPDFTVVAQLFVTERGDLGNFTGSVSGGVGLRVKSAIVGISPRRPSQAFVGSAKIP